MMFITLASTWDKSYVQMGIMVLGQYIIERRLILDELVNARQMFERPLHVSDYTGKFARFARNLRSSCVRLCLIRPWRWY
jgi:hypothetical protein